MKEHMLTANHATRLARMLRRCVGYENGPSSTDEVDLYSLGHSHNDTNGTIAQQIIDDARALLDSIGEL